MNPTTAALLLALVLPLTACKKADDAAGSGSGSGSPTPLAGSAAPAAGSAAPGAGSAAVAAPTTADPMAPAPGPAATRPDGTRVTAADLPALFDQAVAMTRAMSAATKDGDCAAKARRLGLVLDDNAAFIKAAQAIDADPTLRPLMDKLGESRGAELDAAGGTMLAEAADACGSDPTFKAVLDRLDE